ncbi:MAG: hypothetical protein L6W00_07235 [Lentisphaeria bacterium]|nr:MAG: hypothetical protein L6W00_07235 [Lentisphaeria bacterium]
MATSTSVSQEMPWLSMPPISQHSPAEKGRARPWIRWRPRPRVTISSS